MKFNSNGGSTVSDKTVAVGATTTAPTNPTRANYTFKGWYTAASGGTKIAFPYKPTKDITLYAQWTPKTYKITFNSNGGSAVTAKSFSYGSKVQKPTNPTKSGYAFNGWFTKATGGTKVAFPIAPTGNMTVYAQWVKKSTTPTTITVSKPSTTSASVKWSGATGASGYEVYYGTTNSANSSFVSTTKLTYTKSSLTKGKTYYFKVRSYVLADGAKVYSGFSKVVSVKI